MGVKAEFDTLFDNIITILETYSAAQYSDERFTVYPDRYRDLPTDTGIAQIFLYLNSINPENRTAAGFIQYEAEYWLDLVVKAKGTRSGSAYSDASEAAGVRLRYLIKQVMEALFPAGNRNLSIGAGKVSKKSFSVAMFIPENIAGDRPTLAARLTLNVGLAWEPTPITGPDMDSILVTADKWSALIEP